MTVRRIVPNLAGDPSAASELFVDVLGLDVAMDHGWIVTYAAGPVTEARPQVSVIREDATAPVIPVLSVEVDDVDGCHARAVERGYEIVHPLTDEVRPSNCVAVLESLRWARRDTPTRRKLESER